MEFKDKQSIYLQIADFICEQIVLAKWPPGGRIASVRDLAGEFGEFKGKCVASVFSRPRIRPTTTLRKWDPSECRKW